VSSRALTSASDRGFRDTISVAIWSDPARNKCRPGSLTPISNSAATVRLISRPVSLTSPGAYQRLTVNTPLGDRRDRTTRQPSVVYRPFSLNVNAPAPVDAQVSIRVIWIRSNASLERAYQLLASSATSTTRGTERNPA